MAGVWTLLLFGLSVAAIAIGTGKFRVHPFPLLLAVGLIYGLLTGSSPASSLASIKSGFGAVFSNVGIPIAVLFLLGGVFGKARIPACIRKYIAKGTDSRRLSFTALAAGWAAGVCVPPELGFLALAPAAQASAHEKGMPGERLLLPLAAGALSSGALLAPTALPLAAAAGFAAGIGPLFLIGMPASLAAAAAGMWWIRISSGRPDAELAEPPVRRSVMGEAAAPAGKTSLRTSGSRKGINPGLLVLLPLALVSLGAVAGLPGHPFGSGFLFAALSFMGDPIVAFLLAALCASLIGLPMPGFAREGKPVPKNLSRAAELLLILGASGAYAQVIRSGSLPDLIVGIFGQARGGVFFPFVMAAVLKLCTGSSLIAVVTTAGALAQAPLARAVDPALSALAACSGAMVFVHANDPWFWLVADRADISGYGKYGKISLTAAIQGFASFAVVVLGSLAGL